LFFLTWMRSVWISEKEANFKNSLRMNVIATLCTTIFFVTLILFKP
jgi:1,4-dihydroxy-2-naphthoate polyprenyltransferase